jgi:hypothetical protein
MFKRYDDDEVFKWFKNQLNYRTFENICMSAGLSEQECKQEKMYAIRHGTLSNITGKKLMVGIHKMMKE